MSRAIWQSAVRLAVVLLALGVTLGGCQMVVRRADTLTVEGWAAVLRQEEAAQQLVVAAEERRRAGDGAGCEELLTPALEIEARARHQWARGLYLAGLTYPDETGELPPARTRQPDPGPSPPVRSAAELCGSSDVLEYSPRSTP